RTPAQVFFVASTQEEVGLRGARTATYAVEPDMGIAVDVTHATSPGTGPSEAFPIDKVCLATGPNIHKGLLKMLRETAKRIRVDCSIEVASGPTGTDAAAMQLSRGGVPCVLISLPLKYMHTVVETLSLDVVRETGRLMAAFIDDAARGWEAIQWY
ncbi:MAG: M42 family metallopeptidase, partial [Clostridiales bacterium]|nr:M42 family metallopeptidase [Clostridiales bacterium]